MGQNTAIQWTDNSHNFWEGCKKVSAGCKNCYAERMFSRFGKDFSTVRRIKNFDAPLKWKEPAKVFTCSTSDFFIDQADAWRPEAWEIIKATPHLQYQILTKRPERILQCLPPDWGEGYANVWLGISVEDQAAMELRMPIFVEVEAKIKFLSCEPLLGPLVLPRDWSDGSTMVDWVIIGGESGNETGKYRYREAKIEWFYDLIQQCREANCPVFMKQTGTFLAKQMGFKDRHGGDIDEWPLSLRHRKFPNIDAWNRKA